MSVTLARRISLPLLFPALSLSLHAAPLGGGGDVVTFEGLPAGTILDQVFGAGGAGPITVFGTNPAFPGENAAIIFDSANPTGGDPDLGTPNEDFGGPGKGAAGELGSPFQNDVALGNLLILGEDLIDGDGDGLVDDPDDADLPGETLEFGFPFPAQITGLTIIDVEEDEANATASFFNAADVLITELVIPNAGDNGVIFAQSDISGVVRLVITLNGSGGFDNLVFRVQEDCNGNMVPDDEDIASGTSQDCNGNGIPDECEDDCNGNGIPDDCDVATGASQDCNENGIPDECEDDCNGNGVPDDCDVASGFSTDFNGNGIPDECEPCDPNDLSIAGTWKLDNGPRKPLAGVTFNNFRPLGDRLTLDFEDPESCVWMVTDANGLVCIFGEAVRVTPSGSTGEKAYLEFCYQSMNPFVTECGSTGRRESGAPSSIGPVVGTVTWLPTGGVMEYASKSVSNGTYMQIDAKNAENCEFLGSGWLMATDGNSTGDWFFGVPCE